ncbi:MAG: putative manganese transporter [Oscillospiraceae bacterium]|nr:putative manganese transporter [Oscillospiraceae bacterium]
MWNTILDILKDTGMDTLKTIPVLFLAYLLMEFLEHRTGERTANLIRKSGYWGPLYGGLLGVVPQCGFSAAASSLYAGRVITLGTLIAVYLSTSDEMLPIFLSENVPASTILKILGTKAGLGILAGFLIDAAVRIFRSRHNRPTYESMDIEHVCEHDHAHTEEDGVLVSALKHTVKITVYLFLVSLILNGLISWLGEARLASILSDRLVLSELLAGIVGLIPNCAASVVITQLYLEGMIGAGPMMAGLLVGAGIGLLVLVRENEPPKKNAAIIGILYVTGVFLGTMIDLLHITF